MAVLLAGGVATVLGFSTTGSLATGRTLHSTTLLQNGKVLVAGGANPNVLGTTELYDPSVGTWVATGSLVTARQAHTATMLQNGVVLITGGIGTTNNVLINAELYDPASGKWKATGSLTNARYAHTATLLPSGKVLVAGGYSTATGFQGTAELYDPATGKWTVTGNLNVARDNHTATLLSSGKVLIAGGQGATGTLKTAELYDPANGMWVATGSLGNARYFHTATLLPSGKVLVVEGQNGGAVGSAELYNPATNSWNTTPSPTNSRYNHTATLLPDGTVMVAGGFDGTNYLTSVEFYDPSNGANGSWFTNGASLAFGRANHTATLLPNGPVLFAAGFNGAQRIESAKYLASAELYDSSNGTWSGTNDFTTARDHHTATLLPNGKVLIAGAFSSPSDVTAELYDPASGMWKTTGSLGTGRVFHTATLLPNGKVLVAAGFQNNTSSPLASAELYDPSTGMWSATTGGLANARLYHTATLLPNGKVLVTGGNDGAGHPLASSEIYDPSSGTWKGTSSLMTARQFHTATLLPNGKVLVAGGFNGSALPSAELYDPASGTWSTTPGSLVTPRYDHTATLLPNGKVLIAGGEDANSTALRSSELYDPTSGMWKATTGSLITPRDGFPGVGHTATLLPNGKVLVAGGGVTATELYNPATDTWSATGALATPRRYQTATLLPMGRVLVAGGLLGSNPVNTAELYDVGLGFMRPAWQPQIVTTPSTLTLGGSLALTGSLFQGVSQASGGNTQDSSTNYPIVQLRTIDSGWSIFLPTAGWSNTAFTSLPVSGFPFGPALVTVFTNGIPSDAKYLVVIPPTVLANISTRLLVGTGDNVLIGGFIVTGTQSKKVLIRAIGPSLPLAGVLADPTLELYQGTTLLESNDNWMDSANKQAIIDSTIPPSNPLESAIVRSVPPGNYTAIERGVNNGTGIGVVEAYDLDTSANSTLANISTRGLVQTGDNVLFAGMIVVGQSSQKVIIRALGPSTGVPGAMADPTLELRDGNGVLLETNDNWVDSPNKQAIIDSTIPPPNNLESAIVRILTPGNYTAIVRGVNNSTGIAVVEVYALN
jgi:hypothetical protein